MTDNNNLEQSTASCKHCKATHNPRTGKPFTHQGVIAHLKSCAIWAEKRVKRSTQFAAGKGSIPSRREESASLPQDSNEIKDPSRREVADPAFYYSSKEEKQASLEEGDEKRQAAAGASAPKASAARWTSPAAQADDEPVEKLSPPLTPKQVRKVFLALKHKIPSNLRGVVYSYGNNEWISPKSAGMLASGLHALEEAMAEHRELVAEEVYMRRSESAERYAADCTRKAQEQAEWETRRDSEHSEARPAGWVRIPSPHHPGGYRWVPPERREELVTRSLHGFTLPADPQIRDAYIAVAFALPAPSAPAPVEADTEKLYVAPGEVEASDISLRPDPAGEHQEKETQ